MAAKLNQYWRLLVTGVCFLGFSLGGGLLSALVFPVLRLATQDPERRHQWAKWLIHKCFTQLVAVLRATGTMRLEVVGEEQLREARDVLILANHPTLLDIVVLLHLMPRANCVVKSELWGNPFVGGVVRNAGYISNSTPERLIEDCAQALGAGQPLVFFPEGTRSRPDLPLKFLRGAAHVALKFDKLILPVLLQCDPPTLTKGSHWYQIPPRPVCIRVIVKPSLRPTALADTRGNPAIAARRLTAALECYFSRELSAL